MNTASPKPRLIVPETVQTSGMDCGPAALRSLLEGMGVRASYGRLREACQTDVDGTAIEALEQAARSLGLDVAQLMLPADHVALRSADALPSLAVSVLPSGMPHFVIVWRRHGPMVQLMDPGTGRRFVRARGLLPMLYIHEQPVPAAAWEAFSESPAFREPLAERLRALGLRAASAQDLMSRADAAGPQAMAALDARARAAASNGDRRATAADLRAAIEDPHAARRTLPPDAWFARPLDGDEVAGDEPLVLLRGAVVVRARGHAEVPPDPATLPPDLRAVLTEPAPRPARRLLAAARAAGRVPLGWLLAGGAALAAGAIAETALLREALNASEPGSALALVALVAAGLMIMETAVAASGLAVGRRLEIGLRRALLVKLPKLPDRYLRSRAPSDMAERAHVLHALRTLPLLAVQLLGAATETLLVAGALCVLDPGGAPLVVAATVLVLGAAVVVQYPLREREQREREHAGALGQTTLDALLGVLPIRAHGGEAALISEQRSRLDGWREAAGAAVRARSAATFVQAACGIGLTIPVVINGLDRIDDPPGRLLFVLWAVMLPFTAERLANIALQWPRLRALALRLAEPLDAPDALGSDVSHDALPSFAGPDRGVEIVLEQVSVRATGHLVVEPTSLRISASEHVALVGASGAGKSTICSLILGLLEPSEGRALVDGMPLDRAAARGLWPSVAWVDSQVRIWNRSLAGNVAPNAPQALLDAAYAAAELKDVAERVGDQPLGADGGLLSGGEGQRVRLARAFVRRGVRLAVLDEALRGLDRGQRHRLLERARRIWGRATLICATHDVEDALAFDRVIVVEGGKVVEDGSPRKLLATGHSRLTALIQAERDLRSELDTGRGWRHVRVTGGTVREDSGATAAPASAPEREPRPKRAAAATDRAPAMRPVYVALAVYAAATAARFAAFAAAWAVIGSAIFEGDVSGSRLTPWALLLASTIPVAALATWAEGRVAVDLGARLRYRLLRGAFGLDPGWVRRDGPGRILGRTMEVESISRLALAGGLDALTSAVQLVVAMTALLIVSPGRPAAALVVLVLAAGAAVAVMAARRKADWTAARIGETDELLEEIAGQRTRLIEGADEYSAERDRRLGGYLQLSARADRPLVALAGALPSAAVVAGLAGLALAAGGASTGDLAAALGGLLLASTALRGVAAATDTLTTAALAARALEPILAAEREQAAGEDFAPPDSSSGLSARGLAVERDGRPVIGDADLTLSPGDRVVLTGASGAGKSTLAAALAGLLPTAAGSLTLDGDGPRPATRAWRSRVQLVPQHHENHVLLAPLAFNLLLGRAWPPTEGDLRAAAEVCLELELGPLLSRMPAGIGQHVGETGWRLSQGERARVQLARALLADPDVLILDEPLGALDPATGRLVLDVVRRRARTLVLISQE